MKRAIASKRSFSIPHAVSEQLDEMIPPQQRSAFVAEVIAEALRERQRTALLELIKNIQPKKVPAGTPSAVDIIRATREGRVQQLSSLVDPHAQ